MQQVINVSRDILKRRFVRYVFVGGSTFLIDFVLLIVLHSLFGIHLLIAATISYWSSIVFNFFINRSWTFGVADSSVAKHLTLYLSLLAFNYGFSIAFIAAATSLGMHFAIAKIIATGFQTIWTYVIYKKIIFK